MPLAALALSLAVVAASFAGVGTIGAAAAYPETWQGAKCTALYNQGYRVSISVLDTPAGKPIVIKVRSSALNAAQRRTPPKYTWGLGGDDFTSVSLVLVAGRGWLKVVQTANHVLHYQGQTYAFAWLALPGCKIRVVGGFKVLPPRPAKRP